MKATLLLFFSFTLVLNAYSQNKTTFIGEVSSEKITVINADASSENAESSTIEFASRVIKIEKETYNIISKQFDGVSTSTFMCSKGRGNFIIKYVAGKYISVSDKRTPGIETRYSDLKE